MKQAGRRFIDAVAGFVARQGLVDDRPVYGEGAFPLLRPIEANWLEIRAELDELLRDRVALPPFHQISPDQRRISKGEQWKVFILYGFGVPIERNCARCPNTARLLRDVPHLRSAWFSILAPRYHIPRHRGITKTVLRGHLGLVTPADSDRCIMQVDDQTVGWEPGKLFVFDDFYPHEVWNDTDDERVVLIFDFDRPMRAPGRMLNALLMWGIKGTAYYRDAQRNLRNWDDRLEAAVATADGMLDQELPPRD